MDLLFASGPLTNGGAERTLLDWADALSRRGHTTRIVAPPRARRPAQASYWRWRAAQRDRAGVLVAAAIATRRPDAVLAQLHGAPAALAAAAAADIPTILVLPSYESLCKLAFDPGSDCPPDGDCVRCPAALRLAPAERSALAASRHAHAQALAGATALVVPSHTVADAVMRWSGRSSTLVWPLPERLPPALAPSFDGPVICAAARWGPQKGAALLPALVAFARAAAAPPCVREVRVTSAGLTPAARAAIRGAGGTLIAPAPLEQLLDGASLLLVPSQWEEPFGRIAWEALAGGVPVLASDAGGLREQLAAERRVAPRDDPAAWRAAITALLSDRARWQAAADGARVAAAAQIVRSPIDDLEALLRSAAQTRPRNAGSAGVAGAAPAALHARRAVWDQLAAPIANPFSSWLFAELWCRHLAPQRPLHVRAVAQGGVTVALLPLVEIDGTLRFIGYGDGDLLGPVAAPEHQVLALTELAAWALHGGHRLIADEVPASRAAALGGAVRRTTPLPVIDVPPGGFPELLASRSRNLRESVSRRRRRLERAHDVTVRAANAQSLERDLDTLMTLHHARWGRASTVFSGPRVAFHRELAYAALSRGWLRLRLLELDGRPVAATYGFRVGQAEWFYQTGRDPAFEGASVGVVLFAATVRAACEEGAREFWLGRGDQRYKRSWATRDAAVQSVLVERA